MQRPSSDEPKHEPEPDADEEPEPDADEEPEPPPDDQPPEPNPQQTPSERSKRELKIFADTMSVLKKLFFGSVERLVDADAPDSDVETIIDSLRYLLKLRAAARKPPSTGNDVPTDQSAKEMSDKPAALPEEPQ